MADLISEQPTADEASSSAENNTVASTSAIESNQNDTAANNEDATATANVNIFEQLPLSTATPTPLGASIFMKIRLKETDDMLLFDMNSCTALRDTAEASIIEEDNKRYDYLVMGTGKHRKTNDVETQTLNALYKTRAINTDHIEKSTTGTFVSNYDMYDTYSNLERTTECIQIDYNDRHEQLDITTYSKETDGDLSNALKGSKSFHLSSMILERILAGNIYCDEQRRFRNMEAPNTSEPTVHYLYRLKLLYRYRYHETSGTAVSCMSWCPSNTDILAIGYGVFKCEPCKDRQRSAVCLWNIKNPVNPERCYKYSMPVTAVSFSNENSQLLAIGFYDGSVRIVDITTDGATFVMISQRKTSPPIEPVWQIKWIKFDAEEELLTISQDGYVMKYSLANSLYLIGSRQMQLHISEESSTQAQTNRFAQLLTIEMHPLKPTVYFVGTGEGCLHECSIFDPYQHKRFMHVHKYGIYFMEFSPWSPKIFLTCGVDWTIRIWIEDIDEPIIELRSGFEPIKCASWCSTNSTIIVSTTPSALNIWDLKTNCLQPAAMHRIRKQRSEQGDGNGNDDGGWSIETSAELTICHFTNCGRSIVVGSEDGVAFVFALEDMPFSSHFQYDALEEAIMRSLVSRPELKRKIKQLGFLGY